MRKLLSFLVIIFFLILNFNLLKSSYESANKLDQLSEESKKVKELEEINQNLKLELEERNSPYFIEQEARNRLGYSKQGESVIVVENSDIGDSDDNETTSQSNFQKWLELLRI